MKRATLLYILLSLSTFCSYAQEGAGRAIHFISKGQQALFAHQYEKAQRFFSRALELKPGSTLAQRGLAMSSELTGSYERAAFIYDEILLTKPYFSRVLYFEAAQTHFQTGNYERAIELFYQFEHLQELAPSDFGFQGETEQGVEQQYLPQLSERIHACFVAMDSIQFRQIPYVFNLGDAVNTDADEYFPCLSNDQALLFYTSRSNLFSDEDLYYTYRLDINWEPGRPIGTAFNTSHNEGMSTLVRNGRKLFFTACNRAGVLGPCDIWEAAVEGKTIRALKSLEGAINSEFWESQAAISCDGETLFFASNRADGHGGTDIWKCRKNANETWGPPENLGPVINTEADEEAPFITNDGQTLYFSSTGHPGMGEQDIFMSRLHSEGQWTKPANLGLPVNSSYRELGFFLSADGRTGYFSSDREGGRGGMDIYNFELPNELINNPITLVEGVVIDSFTQQPLLTNVYLDNRTIQTDENGRFFLCLPANERFQFTILESDYEAYYRKMTIPEWDNTIFYALTARLIPVDPPTIREIGHARLSSSSKFLRHSVYFDFNKWDLNSENIRQLRKFLADHFPTDSILEVEIVGYADQIGSSKYNLVLSERRAKSVAVFLKQNGIRVDRIYIEGGGELQANIPDEEKRKVEVVFKLR